MYCVISSVWNSDGNKTNYHGRFVKLEDANKEKLSTVHNFRWAKDTGKIEGFEVRVYQLLEEVVSDKPVEVYEYDDNLLI